MAPKAYMAGMIEAVIYLLTPEGSVLSGFGQNTIDQTNSGFNMRGAFKIVFCVLLSIFIASMIARLG